MPAFLKAWCSQGEASLSYASKPVLAPLLLFFHVLVVLFYSNTKHSLIFSTSCRSSPAINSSIQAFKIQRGTTPEATAAALAVWPRLARMRKLTVDANDVQHIFTHLLGSAPDASIARLKLQHVDWIQFKVSRCAWVWMLLLSLVCHASHKCC